MLAFPKNQCILVFLFFPDLAKIEFHEISQVGGHAVVVEQRVIYVK